MPIHLDLALNSQAGVSDPPWLYQSAIVAELPDGIGVTVTIREDEPLAAVMARSGQGAPGTQSAPPSPT